MNESQPPRRIGPHPLEQKKPALSDQLALWNPLAIAAVAMGLENLMVEKRARHSANAFAETDKETFRENSL
jgi:hypothetical protein